VSDSLIGRSVAVLAMRETLTPLELQQIMSQICETKEQASNLTNQLQRCGYIERVVIVTPRAKARALA
jgi:hypothetical protein